MYNIIIIHMILFIVKYVNVPFVVHITNHWMYLKVFTLCLLQLAIEKIEATFDNVIYDELTTGHQFEMRIADKIYLNK